MEQDFGREYLKKSRPNQSAHEVAASALGHKELETSIPQITLNGEQITRHYVARNFTMLLSMKRRFAVVALLPLCFASHLVIGQEQSPLEADVQVRVNYNDRRPVPFRTRLEGGGAAVRGSVQNLPGGETAVVLLHFDYSTNADIALDELISQIVVSTSDKAGNEFSRVTIDPNTVPLNPNRASLYYSATLYQPPRGGRSLYITHIQVFGNYK